MVTNLILCLISFFFNMEVKNPTQLMGKHISCISNSYIEVENSIQEKELGIKRFKSEINLNFLGEDFQGFFFKTNKNHEIIEVKFMVYQISKDPNYMDKFVENFNEPIYSTCVDKIIKSSETILDNGNTAAGSIVFKTKKCDYKKESPVFSVWKIREDFYLEIVHPDNKNTYKKIKVLLTKSLPE